MGTVSPYCADDYFRATYIHDGKILRVYRKTTLSELMSKICDEVYAHMPIINNEVISKNEITNMATNSRNKIIAALLRSELEPNFPSPIASTRSWKNFIGRAAATRFSDCQSRE